MKVFSLQGDGVGRVKSNFDRLWDVGVVYTNVFEMGETCFSEYRALLRNWIYVEHMSLIGT